MTQATDTTNKHTPGPWTVTNGEDQWAYFIDRAVGDVVCAAGNQPGEDLNNANLIAAAPEMLEALEGAASCFGKQKDPNMLAMYSKVKDAIAKAKGEAK